MSKLWWGQPKKRGMERKRESEPGESGSGRKEGSKEERGSRLTCRHYLEWVVSKSSSKSRYVGTGTSVLALTCNSNNGPSVVPRIGVAQLPAQTSRPRLARCAIVDSAERQCGFLLFVMLRRGTRSAPAAAN